MTAPERPLSDLDAAMARQPVRISTNERMAERLAAEIGPGSRREWIDIAPTVFHRGAEWRVEANELQHRRHDAAVNTWRRTTGPALAEWARERRLVPEGVRVSPERWEALVDEIRRLHVAAQAQLARIAATPQQDEGESFAKRFLRDRRVWPGSDGPRSEPWRDWQERQRSGATTTATPVRTSNSRLAAMLRGPAQPQNEPGERLTVEWLRAHLRTSGLVQPYESCDNACVSRVLAHLVAAAEAATPNRT